MAINDIVSTGIFSDLSIQEKQKEKPKTNELGQDAFLKLMITQMNNQNPLDPQENSEFVAQLAQFSTVEGIDKLNNTVTDLNGGFQSSQALQASSMVGRMVKVPAESAYLNDNSFIAGTIDVPYSTADITMNIYNASNQLVGQQLLGAQPAGDMTFVWTGLDDNGQQLPSGRYRFEAVAASSEGPQQLATDLSANVDSVTVGANGTLTLNVAGVGPVSISDVSEIL